MPNNNRVSFEKFPAHFWVQDLEDALNNVIALAQASVDGLNSAQNDISNRSFEAMTPEVIKERDAQNDELIAHRWKVEELAGLLSSLFRMATYYWNEEPVTGSEAEIDAHNQTKELVLKLGELIAEKEHEDNQNCRRPSNPELDNRIRRFADHVCAVNADQCEAVS